MPFNLTGGRIETSIRAKFQALQERLSNLVSADLGAESEALQVTGHNNDEDLIGACCEGETCSNVSWLVEKDETGPNMSMLLSL